MVVEINASLVLATALASRGLLEIDAPSRRSPQPRQHGRLPVCVSRRVDGFYLLVLLNAWIQATLALGAPLQRPPGQEPFGTEAWLLDPEGQPPAAGGVRSVKAWGSKSLRSRGSDQLARESIRRAVVALIRAGRAA